MINLQVSTDLSKMTLRQLYIYFVLRSKWKKKTFLVSEVTIKIHRNLSLATFEFVFAILVTIKHLKNCVVVICMLLIIAVPV